MTIVNENSSRSRRKFFRNAFASIAISTTGAYSLQAKDSSQVSLNGEREAIRITQLETFKVKPRFLFLKVHTDAGIIGLGEPITEGRADTCAMAIKEMEPYLLGKDARKIVHHWQALYRHSFYRGGPILTSALSGLDQALWDIKGKALGVPIYELLGGPTRDRIRVYAHARSVETVKKAKAEGFTAFKTSVKNATQSGIIASQQFIEEATQAFAELKAAAGKDGDVGIDFHGAISPQNAALLIHALEPHQPFFIEEPVNCQNVDIMARLAKETHLPIATGERIFTKWGFREILEKQAASILQPDLCHAGGIFEGRLIAGMAEAHYASIAPHNPLGPISLASGLQLAASIPNFLCQEQVTLGEGYIKKPFVVKNGHVDIPTDPGLGIQLDEDAIADKLGHEWRNRESYLESDGSVVDW
ncbi:galactonate dehydratase [Flexithrix dorotheae]|uniref:galactonate dehydratase n=1 Tax=Flexithrix dorotheae TaxID=70993 RepID=UPI000368399E|nr:galactonate dehydratase [Flexithrix dorotheae]